MKFRSWAGWVAVAVTALSTATGCSTAAQDDESGASTGATTIGGGNEELPLIEQTLLLTSTNAAARKLRGKCTSLHVGGDAAADVHALRYGNGAVFYKGTDATRIGASDPIVCVELDIEGGTVTLDGIALDAVFRYGLGAPQRFDGGEGPGGRIIIFENGSMRVGDGAGQYAEDPGEALVFQPRFAEGDLTGIEVDNAVLGTDYYPDVPDFSGEAYTARIKGDFAAFVYSAAALVNDRPLKIQGDALGMAVSQESQRLVFSSAADGMSDRLTLHLGTIWATDETYPDFATETDVHQLSLHRGNFPMEPTGSYCGPSAASPFECTFDGLPTDAPRTEAPNDYVPPEEGPGG